MYIVDCTTRKHWSTLHAAHRLSLYLVICCIMPEPMELNVSLILDDRLPRYRAMRCSTNMRVNQNGTDCISTNQLKKHHHKRTEHVYLCTARAWSTCSHCLNISQRLTLSSAVTSIHVLLFFSFQQLPTVCSGSDQHSIILKHSQGQRRKVF